MSDIGRMVVKIVGDNADFDAKVDASEKKFLAFGKKLADAGKKLTTFVTLPLVGIGLAAVKSAADLEMQQAAFETMLGSAKKATKLLADLKEMAAKTPFQLSDLADASKTLLSFGVEADRILPIVRQLGDVAQGNGPRFQALSLAFAQVQATGRLMGQDLLQMINAGFNPLQEIAAKTGLTIGELKKKMEEGAISAEMVADAFASATSEGGRFFGGMERASKTLSGQWSTLMDNMAELGRSFADILMPAIKDTIAGISRLVQEFTALDPKLKTFILGAAIAVAGIGPLVLIVGKLILAFNALKLAIATNPLGMLAVAIGIVVAVIAGLVIANQAAKRATEDHSKAVETDTAALEANAKAEARRILLIDIEIAKSALAANARDKQTAAIVQERIELEAYLAGLNAELKALDDQGSKKGGLKKTEEELAKERKEAWEEEAKRRDAQADAEAKINSDRLDQIGREAEAEAEMRKARDEAAQQVQTDAAAEIVTLEDVAARTAELRAAGEAGREAAHKKELARAETVRDKWISTAQQIVTALAGLARTLADRQIAEIERAGDAQITEIERQRDAALAADGVRERTTIERLQAELAEAIEKGDAETIAKVQDELDRAIARETINADYDKQRKDAEEAIAKDKRKALHDAAVSAKAFAIFQVILDTANSVMAMLKLGPAGIPLSIAAAIAGGIQTAVIAATPVPALAAGGIAMPRNGGVTATVAEGGQPEAIIPLDRLDEVFSRWPGMGSQAGGDLHLQVNLDSEVLLKTIFPATQRGLVLIDARALV